MDRLFETKTKFFELISIGRQVEMYKLFCLALLTLVLAINAETKIRFDNHRVFSLKVTNEKQMKILRGIESQPSDGYQFWNSVVPGKKVDLMVAPHKLDDFKNLANSLALEYELKIEDVQL